MTIAPFYEGWGFANASLAQTLGALSDEQLRIEIRPGWPIWASAAHVAGGRVYWLCRVFGEPGAETTPFLDPDRGWEDDPTHPRGATEIVEALQSTFALVERCLATWSPVSLSETARVVRGDTVRLHSRQSVLWRLATHDAFHAGEISNTLGAHGLGSASPNGAIDLWSGLSRSGALNG